jgi:hypothetical protein
MDPYNPEPVNRPRSRPRTKVRPSRLLAVARPSPPRPARPRVYADTSVITARSGRVGLVHLARCPFEVGAWHLHRSALGFTSGRRAASCGRGSYELVGGVLGIVSAEAA